MRRGRADLCGIKTAWVAEGDAAQPASEKGQRRGHRELKKINKRVGEWKEELQNDCGKNGTVRLMFQDEAGFGRINKPKYCWCKKGIGPSVPCHHIWEYRYVYGAVEPLTGDSCFLILPYCNTVCMNLFLKELSRQFPDDIILLCCDGAAWHKSKNLEVPENIVLFYIPPYTQEMNPIEQIWKKIRNEVFPTLDKVVLRLCDTISSFHNSTISSITSCSWIREVFY